MSLVGLLSIARSALLAQQEAVSVVGHNIANAATAGYTRQRADLGAVDPEWTPAGLVGRGVELITVERARLGFLDDSWRRETGLEHRYRTLADTLEQVAGGVAETDEVGLSASLDRLIDAFHAVAANPIDPTARAVLLSSARELVDTFHGIATRLEATAQAIGSQLSQSVQDANSYLAEIARLNGQILSSGGQAPDLLDRRDLLIDRLAQIVDVRVIPQGQGTVDVMVGGQQVVSAGGQAQTLAVTGNGPYQIELGSPPTPLAVGQGRIRGLLDAFATLGTRGTATARATGLRGQLDDFALAVVAAVNEIHSDYDPTTKPLQPVLTPPPAPLRSVGPFFDPNGVTAASIQLDPAIVADPTLIAAGYSTAPGDNTIARQLASLRHLAVPIPGSTPGTPSSPAVVAGPAAILGEYYTGLIAGLGVATRDADLRATSQATLTGHLDRRRQAESGVSIDEEMTRLILHQQAYAAAARLVQVADEMMRELVELGR
jgi:flagellar hook-associated protein 1 FlgK